MASPRRFGQADQPARDQDGLVVVAKWSAMGSGV
jgi:hypothetical protein